MNRRYVLLALLFLTAGFPHWGCGGSGGGPGFSTLTSDQQAAVNNVTGSLRSLAGVLGGALNDLEASDFSAQGGSTGPSGTCPAKSVAKNGQSSLITLDYGSGCSAGGTSYAGAATVNYVFGGNQATLAFQNFAVNNRPVTGTMTLAVNSFSSPLSLSGSTNLTVDNTTLSGPFSLTVADNGLITIPTANLTVTSGTSYSVALTNLVINPTNNSSGLPQSGTAAIGYTPPVGNQAITLTVGFTSDTPTNRNVLVSVNGSSPIRYTLPQ